MIISSMEGKFNRNYMLVRLSVYEDAISVYSPSLVALWVILSSVHMASQLSDVSSSVRLLKISPVFLVHPSLSLCSPHLFSIKRKYEEVLM